jgi:hypothetical protein
MSAKNVLKDNRVYLASNKNTSHTSIKYVSTQTTHNFTGTDTKLYVNNTNDFKDSGEILVGNTKYTYSDKGPNYFTINKATFHQHIGLLIRLGTTIKQEYYDNSSHQLAGWYVDGKSKKATLKVDDSPVIMPGAIRYVKDSPGKFQGCVSTDGEPTWVDFNATQGPAGKDGNINTCIKYETVGSNQGQLFSIDTIDPSQDTVKVRSITADTKIINGSNTNQLTVRTDDNNVLIGLDNVKEVVYDLTEEVSSIKGNPQIDEKLNCYGEQIRIRVCNDTYISKGQVVAIDTYTDAKTGKQYYGVKPMQLNNTLELLKYQLNSNTPMKYCFGLSRQNGSGGDIINVLVNGIGLLRIGNNIDNMNTISTTQIPYLGYPVLLDNSGFGFVCQDMTKLPDPHLELGQAMEYGPSIAKTNNYILIKFNPSVIDL